MGLKSWSVVDYDKALAKELAAECEIDPIVALIASSRGYTDPMDLEQFLSDEPVFSDPRECIDIEKAADILNESIENGEKIAVYGDYDCDGVTATALLYSFLKAEGADCIYYIPDRFCEGYGMNCDAIRELAAKGVNLIITVDNGIVAFEEALLAKSLGIKLIITDHHLPIDTLPEALAIVDPHRADCPSSFKSVCGAEVAFRLICVMEGREPEELIGYFADLLSVAVLGDIMPLTLENRSIVKFGIEKLKSSPLTGLSALLSVAGIPKEGVDASKVTFGICPRINAAGRMGKAERAVELLITDNMMTALSIANEIDAENEQRQITEKKILKEAIDIIEENKLYNDRVILACGENWHHGVIGIVASRLVEKYGCPVILLSSSDGIATGSGRSIEGFSLYDAINSCRELFIKFGGHKQAAGVTLPAEKIEEFRKAVNSYAYSFDYAAPKLELDCKLNPIALSLDLAEALESLKPYGEGNKAPLFGLYGVKLIRITPIGSGKHLRLLFEKGNNSFQGLLFGVSPEAFCFSEGDILDLAVTVEKNIFNGKANASVLIKALRITDIDDNKVFASLSALKAFRSDRKADFSLILPSREEIGRIFKKIKEKPILKDRIIYLFINEIGYGKTEIALTVLKELGLIALRSDGYFAELPAKGKTSLSNSETFKNLSEGSAIV